MNLILSNSIGPSWVLVASAVMVLATAAVVLAIMIIGAAVMLVRPWRSSPTMIHAADLFFMAGWVFSLAAPIYVLSRGSVER